MVKRKGGAVRKGEWNNDRTSKRMGKKPETKEGWDKRTKTRTRLHYQSVPVHTMKGDGGNGGLAPYILNLDTRNK